MVITHRPIAVAALLVTVGLLAYANSFDNSFHYDDSHSLVENPSVRSLGNIPRFFIDPGTFSALPEARMYRPLLLTTYAFNYAAGEYGVFGYHLVNLALHLANAWLVWALAQRLTGHSRSALFAALLYVVHPVLSEPVNYISSRSSLLATLFLLLAFRQLLRSVDGDSSSPRSLVGLGVLHAAALASKSVAAAFVPITAVIIALYSRQHWRWRQLVPAAVLTLLYIVATSAIITKAVATEPVRSLFSQWATQIKAGPFYCALVAMPVSLNVEPQFEVASHASAAVILAGLWLVSLAYVIARGVRPSRDWRGRRLAMLAAAWFFLALLPSSLVPLNVIVNEHRLYLPMVGAALLLATLWPLHTRAGRRLACLGAAACIGLVVQRNETWSDEETLWEDAVAKAPLMSRPYVNLGKAYLEQERHQEAIAASRKGLGINPNMPRAHYNVGTAYLQQNQLELAIASYDRALALEPQLVEAHTNLGNAYNRLGRHAEALLSYRRAQQILERAEIHHNVGSLFLASGQQDSARHYFYKALAGGSRERVHYVGLVKSFRREDRVQSAIEVLHEALAEWPQDRDFLLMLGDAHAAAGHDEKALQSYRRAGVEDATTWLRLGDEARKRGDYTRARAQYLAGIKTAPDDARLHDGLGRALYHLDRPIEALERFRRAARLDSTLFSAFANIGLVYLKHGRATEALAALERATRLDPELEIGWELLARAHALKGNDDKATAAYRRAIEIAPEKPQYYHNLGMIYQDRGDHRAAARLFRDALARDPVAHHAHNSLGYSLLEQRQFASAAQHFERALDLNPAQPGVYINLASAWINLDETALAIAAYEEALRLLPRDDAMRERVEAQLSLLQVEATRTSR